MIGEIAVRTDDALRLNLRAVRASIAQTMTTYSFDVLKSIHDRTAGRCHLCWEDVGSVHQHGYWEVEHVRPKARGGSNRLSNLIAGPRTVQPLVGASVGLGLGCLFGLDVPHAAVVAVAVAVLGLWFAWCRKW